ncbi:hypothetical protein IV38_GL000174 [Lactobacillus selangorensis]|uniref:Uncharacterized protein n=1 Tax=Lactobacillus selangorensis TaxID=81857 RepID=A0A0R2G087_9LACO|nr:hypothetical protein [Lactobacillus selangorensis]KRN29292.1 hypothetical protein IV38_GL000174 [Lactobacillus selangorensis]KRN34179.1 hypothetical protein IV40_GL000495 [Lactobacillus selangorensis]
MNEFDSDTLILQYVQQHPESVRTELNQYENVITFTLSDLVLFPDGQELFPPMRLHVRRLPTQYVARNYGLLSYFYKRITNKDLGHFGEIWMTTAHLTDRHALLVELSFE